MKNRLLTSSLFAFLILSCFTASQVLAQANNPNWPSVGRISIGPFLGGAGGVDLLHVHGLPVGHPFEPLYSTPAIRMSFQNFDDFIQLGVHTGAGSPNFSMIANATDYILRTSPSFVDPFHGITTGDLIISSQRKGEAIRFATTPSTALNNGIPQDLERMTIFGDGKVKVGFITDPLQHLFNVGGDIFLDEGGVRNHKIRWDNWNGGDQHWIGYEVSNPWWMTFKVFGTEGFTFKSTLDGDLIKIVPPSVDAEGGRTMFRHAVHVGTVNMTSDPGNNVGGTPFLFTVNGSAKVKEMYVDETGWTNFPDFVFEADYELTPLSELDKQIQLLGHLPGMPSAEEVQTKGASLAEMDKAMLQKIEELTLYVIELDKQNKELKAQVNELTK